MRRINVFFRNGFILTVTALIIKFISMWFNIFLSNNIPSSIIGVWTLLMCVFLFLNTIAQSGINLASTRLVAEEKSHGNVNNIPCIMKSCLLYSLVFSVFSIFLTILISPYIMRAVLKNLVPLHLLYILALALPFSSLSSCLHGYFMAMGKIFVISVALFLEIFIQVMLVIFFHNSMLNTTENVCLALILSLVIADFISFSYLFFTYCKQMKLFEHRYIKKYIKEVCKISLPVAIATYLKSGLSTIKNALIPIALTAYGFSRNESLAYYGLISTTIMSLLMFPYTFVQSYSNLLIPKLATYDKRKDMKKIRSISFKSIKVTGIFSLFVCTVFILFSRFINNKFYSNLYIETYLRILSPIIIYVYIDNVVDNILKSLDFQFFVMVINIIDLIVSICFIKTIIPKYGIEGYIFVLYFSEIFNFLLSLLFLKCKEQQKRPKD